MPSSAHEVVVVQQHVLKALCDQGARRLALVVNVFDETAHLDFLSLGLQLNRFGCVNVTTIDVDWVGLGWALIHGDSFNLAGEFLRSIRQHHVEVVREQNFPVVDIAKLVDSGTDLDLL